MAATDPVSEPELDEAFEQVLPHPPDQHAVRIRRSCPTRPTNTPFGFHLFPSASPIDPH